jgi:hypothetical protein
MRESYREGVATHPGPESWIGDRKGAGQALTGEDVGEVLSRENLHVRGADDVVLVGRQHQSLAIAMRKLVPAWSETLCTHGSSLHGNREIPCSTSTVASRSA